MSNNFVESLIGAVVLLVAGFFLAFGYSRTAGGTLNGYPLRAKFASVGSLDVGSDVRISGIKVGTVTKLSLDPKTYEAVVQMKVSDGIKLSTDSTATVASQGLLGGNYVNLQTGADEEMLRPGDTIINTQSATDLMGMIGKAIFSVANKSKDEKTHSQ